MSHCESAAGQLGKTNTWIGVCEVRIEILEDLLGGWYSEWGPLLVFQNLFSY